MPKDKVTLSDIAKEANVSLATVSYTLNRSSKEKISHETRLKVFAAAEKLHYYTKSGYHFAKEKRNHLIGLVFSQECTAAAKSHHFCTLAAEMTRTMADFGYHVVLIPAEELEKDASVLSNGLLDGVFLLDVDSDKYRSLTTLAYMPVVFLECKIQDELFFQIYPDFEKAFELACGALGEPEPFLVMEHCANHFMTDMISSRVSPEKLLFVQEGTNLRGFFEKQSGRGVVFGEYLALQAALLYDSGKLAAVCYGTGAELPKEIPVVSLNLSRLVQKGAEVMINLLSYNDAELPEKLIPVEPVQL